MSENPIHRLDAALEGRYRIVRQLGEGGMASVYLAEDLRHERKVAIKVLRPELAAVMGADRFLAEIKTTASLQHPNILPLFDSGEADSFLFYVMPWVEGESLRDRLDRDRQLPVEEAVQLAVKVAGALESAHQQGVVHRDIKPANILLAKGEPLVADFGIALAVQNAGAGRLTETGLSLGTPYYMSPEQATADRDPGPASDVYSLGCVLYEMLVGEPPFTGASAQAVLAKLLTSEAPEITDQRKTVPDHVAQAIRVALQKLPADRFATAADFAAALRGTGTLPSGAALRGGPASGRAGGLGSGAGLGSPWLPWTAAALCAAAALFFALRPPVGVSGAPTRFSLGLPTADGVGVSSGDLGQIGISPDGRDIVFQGMRSGRKRLFRRALDGLAIEPLPGTEDGVYPTFSPGGREIAFAKPDGVYRLALDGGGPRRVARPPNIPFGMAWTPGQTLVLGMLAYNGDYRGLSEVALGGDGTVEKVTEPEGMHHWPYLLQDGRHALFTDFSRTGQRVGILDLQDDSVHAVEADGGSIPLGWVVGVSGDVLLFLTREGDLMATRWDPDRRRVLSAPIRVPGQPAGLREAVLSWSGTLAMVTRASLFRLALVGMDGSVERMAVSDSVAWAAPRFSPDGRRLLLAAPLGGEPGETWVVDLGSGVTSPLSMGVQPYVAEWTADGSAVLVTSRRQFSPDEAGLWRRPADASAGAERLRPNFGGRLAHPDQSDDDSMRRVHGVSPHPDGVTAALTLDMGSNPTQPNWDVYIGRLDGDSTLVPFAATDADETAARFSPDGHWLAYASSESGHVQVYVRPFPGPGPRVQVSADGGGQPVWAADGKRIFYRTDDALLAADVGVQGGTLRVGARRVLFRGTFRDGPTAPQASYDVSPDGTSFVVLKAVGDEGGDLVVWQNWLDELRPLLGVR